MKEHILPACAGLTAASVASSLQQKTAVVSIATGAAVAGGHLLQDSMPTASRAIICGLGGAAGHAIGTWINSASQSQQTAKYGGLVGAFLVFGGSLLGDYLGERLIA